MKILKYTLLFVMFSIVGLFVLGIINSKMTTEAIVDVDAPVEKSFKVAMNPDLLDEWLSSDRMKLIKIEPKNEVPQPGEKYKVHFTWGEKEIVLEETVKTYIPNQEFSFSLEDSHTEFDINLYFSENDDNGTTIKEISTGGAKNAFFRGLMSLTKSSMQKEKDAQFERLKKLIERESEVSS